jgi:hypothetical protein
MKQIAINRISSNSKRTLSECFLTHENGNVLLEFKGIELPWKNNEPGISCIPPGMYEAKAIYRASNGHYGILLFDVPDRSEIMIHTANFVNQLRGCLAPGTDFADIDKDGIMDVTNSRKVMSEIEKHIPINEMLQVLILSA